MRILIVALALSQVVGCLLPSGPLRDPPRSSGERAVLFIGNSQTYVNDLPSMVKTLAHWGGDTALRVAEIAEPNFALEDHLALGIAERALRESSWRWVVMQQGPSALPESQINLRYYASSFNTLVRAAGAEPVLYQIWPQWSRRFDAEAALTSYWNAAASVSGILAPAGDAFTAALAQTPSINLYSDDGLHASRLGTYVAALVIVERISGIRPGSLPPTVPGSSTDSLTVRRLQQAAQTALDRSPARPTTTRPPIR